MIDFSTNTYANLLQAMLAQDGLTDSDFNLPV